MVFLPAMDLLFGTTTTLSVAALNPFLSCSICKGYLIDATTVTECVHTFCKSCLLKHLRTSGICPRCGVAVHPSNPFHGIRYDPTLQDIVYKIVPDLQRREIIRERIFCGMKGIRYRKSDLLLQRLLPDRQDELICVQLEARIGDALPKKFICCSSRATIMQLKKLVAKKLFADVGKYGLVDILCNDEILRKDLNLKFVSLTMWKARDPPLTLYYQPHMGSLQ